MNKAALEEPGLTSSFSVEDPKKLTREHVEAYQLCLLGRHHWNKWSPEGWRKGIEYFEKAIEVDPNYAFAYAWLGYAYTPIAVYRIDMPPIDAWEKAK